MATRLDLLMPNRTLADWTALNDALLARAAA